MFPPTHRIYRSIRPRNRFIIGNKRRGLQAVSAICISLILIIYGLETIYTMYDQYDQYDFESQNFDHQNRRLGAASMTADEEALAAEDKHHSENQRFVAIGQSGDVHYYSFPPDQNGKSESQWAWYKQKKPLFDPLQPFQSPTYKKEFDLPPAPYTFMYTRKHDLINRLQANSPSPEDNHIEQNAKFVANRPGSGTDPEYYYSLLKDQWWRIANSNRSMFRLVENPPPDYPITYTYASPEAKEAAEHAARVAAAKEESEREPAEQAAREVEGAPAAAERAEGAPAVADRAAADGAAADGAAAEQRQQNYGQRKGGTIGSGTTASGYKNPCDECYYCSHSGSPPPQVGAGRATRSENWNCCPDICVGGIRTATRVL